jgi:transposase
MSCELALVIGRPCDQPGCAASADPYVSYCPRRLLMRNWRRNMRVIGLDVHRSFAQVAELKDGVLRQRGRVDLVRHKVLEFARTLSPDDEVVLEATGNTMAIVRLIKPYARRVVIANPLQVRVIADAKVKTDRIDATVLARLHAAGFLPEVWQPDEATERLRRLVARRAGIVKGMTRAKTVSMRCFMPI